GQSAATFPDAGQTVVWRGVQDTREAVLEAVGPYIGDVPGHHPAVIGAGVAVRCPRDKDGAAHEAQGRPLLLARGIELIDRPAGAVVGIDHAAIAASINVDGGVVRITVVGVAD